MSDPLRVLLLGASGLVGRMVMEKAVGRTDLRLIALARREVPLPMGARMEMLLAPVEGWEEAIAALQPARVICALGTTIRKEGGDRAQFVSVDRDLVLRNGADQIGCDLRRERPPRVRRNQVVDTIELDGSCRLGYAVGKVGVGEPETKRHRRFARVCSAGKRQGLVEEENEGCCAQNRCVRPGFVAFGQVAPWPLALQSGRGNEEGPGRIPISRIEIESCQEGG